MFNPAGHHLSTLFPRAYVLGPLSTAMSSYPGELSHAFIVARDPFVGMLFAFVLIFEILRSLFVRVFPFEVGATASPQDVHKIEIGL